MEGHRARQREREWWVTMNGWWDKGGGRESDGGGRNVSKMVDWREVGGGGWMAFSMVEKMMEKISCDLLLPCH